MKKEEYNPYCEVCGGCGIEGCCSPIPCTQSKDGKFCKTYLKDLKFGYLMYKEICKIIPEGSVYEEEIDKIRDRVWDNIYRSNTPENPDSSNDKSSVPEIPDNSNN